MLPPRLPLLFLLLLPAASAAAGFDFCPTLAPEHLAPREATAYGPPAERLRGHRLEGPASYYADMFEGRKTASGEVFRQRKMTAAHRTLPFGTELEVRARATGRSVRVRVNDRGPFKGGFVIDLSREAARAIGVDRTRDRWVELVVIDLPE